MEQQTILILHGWGRFTGSWTPIKELLEKQGYQVFYPPLPGLDKNQPLEKPWTVNDYAEWVKSYAEQNNLGQFFLLGHSFGGRVSIKFTVKYPEKLKGLILVSSAGIRKEKTVSIYNTISKLAEITNKLSFIPGYSLIRKFFYRFILKRTEYIILGSQIMKDTFGNVIKEDLTPLLNQIRVPSLILWGQNDKTTPIKDAQLMKELIPGSLINIIPEAGHRLHIETPQLLAEKVVGFIQAN